MVGAPVSAVRTPTCERVSRENVPKCAEAELAAKCAEAFPGRHSSGTFRARFVGEVSQSAAPSGPEKTSPSTSEPHDLARPEILQMPTEAEAQTAFAIAHTVTIIIAAILLRL